MCEQVWKIKLKIQTENTFAVLGIAFDAHQEEEASKLITFVPTMSIGIT